MKATRRWIAFFLLFVFGMMFFKNVLPSLGEPGSETCEAFAHIHFYRFGKISKTDEIQKQGPDGDDDDGCHEGKSLAGTVILSSPDLKALIPLPSDRSFSLVPSMENHFPAPDLEPRKKPPRNFAES